MGQFIENFKVKQYNKRVHKNDKEKYFLINLLSKTGYLSIF